jgi:hypothetical protein
MTTEAIPFTEAEIRLLKAKGYGEEFIKLNPKLRDVLGRDGVAPSKYRNIPANGPGGRTFQSGREAARAGELELAQKAGQICNLAYQVPFDISPPGHSGRPIYYIADFVYIDLETFAGVVEDAKGIRTDVYKLKKKLFESKFKTKIKEV